MYVCICLAVTDSQVGAAIDSGACSVEGVTERCGAGGDCGACRGMIEEMLDARTAVHRRTLPMIGASTPDSEWNLAIA